MKKIRYFPLIMFYITICIHVPVCLIGSEAMDGTDPRDPEIALSRSAEAKSDLSAFQSMASFAESDEYLRSLPLERRLNLAHDLLNDSDGKAVYLGCQILIINGNESETFGPLARLIAEGKDKTDLNGRMGYDWAHMDDDNLPLRMMMGMLRSLNSNYLTYGNDERARALSVFNNMGHVGNYDQQLIEVIIDNSFASPLNNGDHEAKTPENTPQPAP